MFHNYTNLYSVTKTLRFKLNPIGKTLQHIQEKGFLTRDEQKAKSYKLIKTTIDEYHKDFIARAMADVDLTSLNKAKNVTGLDDFYQQYMQNKQQPTDAHKKRFEKAQEELRKEIVKGFSAKGLKQEFSELFKKELITKNLKNFVAQQNHKGIQLFCTDDFDTFTTYFSGFHENRKNIYSSDAKHTALAFRLVHENAPKYFENTNALQTIQQKNAELYTQLELHINSHIIPKLVNGFAGAQLDDLTTANFYNQLLTQAGIDAYNQILGGFSQENGTKVQGINELINLYNQQLPKTHKNLRAPKLKPLYKQILSDRSSLSFLPQKFEDDSQLYSALNDYYLNHVVAVHDEQNNQTVLEILQQLVTSLDSYDTNKIYLKNDRTLGNIAQALFGNYAVFGMALTHYYQTKVATDHAQKYAKAKSDSAREKLEKQQQNFVKGYHSVAIIEQAYADYIQTLEDDEPLKNHTLQQPIVHYFTHCATTKKEADKPQKCLFKVIDNRHSTIKGTLNSTADLAGVRELLQKGKAVVDIKNFTDAIMDVLHFVKPLAMTNSENFELDAQFYNEFVPVYEQLQLFVPVFNKVRDYISQKPYSTDKFKLNFDNAQLLNGWDANKEKDYLSVMLKKDGKYYLALLDKEHKKVFEQAPKAQSTDTYQKMHYKLLPGANKMLPKVFFSKKNIDFFAPSAQLLENYKNETHKKGDTFNIKHCHQLIDFFKQSLAKHKDWKQFGFSFSDTKTYQDLSDFYKEVAQQGYKVTFHDVDASYINELVADGKLYLFQIYNKDFAPKAHGKQNLHTMYFTELFSKENLADTIYKLNGEAELFYRKASLKIEHTTVHKKGERVHTKNPNTPNASRVLDYDIIKDRRFTTDSFMFHVPVTMNFKADGMSNKQFNTKVRQTIHTDAKKDINIIGIDRGERHLLYVTVVNQHGDILHQESLNSIVSDDKRMSTPYHTLLDNREKERDNARKNWGVIENIKELKAGYLSQVVHKIAQLMLQYNAMVVLEDLNFGFKNGRFKVEKQVYQKFEKALIDKLNYLVIKDSTTNQTGHVRQAYQLTAPFTAFKDLGKQTGWLFYVPAWNTSKIDPTTGFVDLLKPRYENLGQAQEFITHFDSIRYNANHNYFEFAFDYQNFTTKADGTRTHWTLCSHGNKRYVYDKKVHAGKGGQKAIDITAELKSLLTSYGIDYQQGDDLRPFISSANDKKLYSGIIYLLKALLAMRYSINHANGDVEDFILSPVADDMGNFFDSRTYENTAQAKLPQDADANGAYHIALKGLWAMQQIQSADADSLDKVKLAVTNKDWLQFAQNSKAKQIKTKK